MTESSRRGRGGAPAAEPSSPATASSLLLNQISRQNEIMEALMNTNQALVNRLAAMPTTGGAGAGPRITRPRVGGRATVGSEELAWTGGGCFGVNVLVGPRSSKGYRSNIMKAKVKTEEGCCEGLGDSKKLSMKEDSKVTFIQWINLVRERAETTGMDTVFHVSIDGATEINILKQFGALTLTQIHNWSIRLRDGEDHRPGYVIANTPCPYDVEHLSWSRKMIENSIDNDLWRSIQKELEPDTSGPEIFKIIVSKFQASSANMVRSLMEKLDKLRLNEDDREDVSALADKVSEICRQIEGSGSEPPDLAFVVAGCFQESTVNTFMVEAAGMHSELNRNVGRHTWRDSIQTLTASYNSLSSSGKWPPAKKHETKTTEALNARITKLEQKENQYKQGNSYNNGNENGGGNGQYNYRNHQKKCYTCGSTEHLARNCPNRRNDGSNGNDGQTKHPSRIPPKDGESEIRTRANGEKEMWCDRCKRWRTGPKAHTTNQHRATSGNNQGNGGSNENEGPPSSPSNYQANLGVWEPDEDEDLDISFGFCSLISGESKE